MFHAPCSTFHTPRSLCAMCYVCVCVYWIPFRLPPNSHLTDFLQAAHVSRGAIIALTTPSWYCASIGAVRAAHRNAHPSPCTPCPRHWAWTATEPELERPMVPPTRIIRMPHRLWVHPSEPHRCEWIDSGTRRWPSRCRFPRRRMCWSRHAWARCHITARSQCRRRLRRTTQSSVAPRREQLAHCRTEDEPRSRAASSI